ncbi:hypothetical protein H6G00_00585 [Leptolyngbya sp. FACHB-541]|uniref:hypothetical protein n=1 Tax=Leptolyngbya sp. FACHB-541 TaxID=2692810 RepID=UPI0016881404|nr:hypothetical protein [Leptolyngbya sp. FACHB-541]MBD1995125.1 hypothetical protein [Leptolyngbya sp. FACHB-541]
MNRISVEIVDTELFKFSKPIFNIGQKVKTSKGSTGYVVGLDFYPEAKDWAYGVYFTDEKNRSIEEDWFSAEQLVTSA